MYKIERFCGRFAIVFLVLLLPLDRLINLAPKEKIVIEKANVQKDDT